MAFVDELTVSIKAGNGGHGVVRWLHEKGKEFMGPAGGNGGNGGDVFVKGVSDLGVLAHYRHKKLFKAERGEDGQSKSKYGQNGKDLIIEIPVGSMVTNNDTGKVYDIAEIGEPVLILKGGRGGLGNEHFKGSMNIRPMEHTDGKVGEEAMFTIELLLAASLGLIGLPNAGKSSLLNAVTNAEAKVGDYQFTTLEPNLGAFLDFIIADIPGLIEGAGQGKGLGHKFLRHVMRTKILAHCVSVENEDMGAAYDTIRHEIKSFDILHKGLVHGQIESKDEIVIMTKVDSVLPEVLETKRKALKKHLKRGAKILEVSVYDDVSLAAFKKELLTILQNTAK